MQTTSIIWLSRSLGLGIYVTLVPALPPRRCIFLTCNSALEAAIATLMAFESFQDGQPIPNGDRAVVALEKLTAYALNPDHRDQRGNLTGKSRIFDRALGLRLEHTEVLRDELLRQAKEAPARLAERIEHGTKFCIEFDMQHGDRKARVRALWIIRNDEDFPRLITVYPLKPGAKR